MFLKVLNQNKLINGGEMKIQTNVNKLDVRIHGIYSKDKQGLVFFLWPTIELTSKSKKTDSRYYVIYFGFWEFTLRIGRIFEEYDAD